MKFTKLMVMCLVLVSLSGFLIGCAKTTQREVVTKVEEVKVPVPTAFHPIEDTESAYVLDKVKKTRRNLKLPLKNSSDVLQRKSAFPSISFLAEPGKTTLDEFFAEVYNSTGWQMVFLKTPSTRVRQHRSYLIENKDPNNPNAPTSKGGWVDEESDSKVKDAKTENEFQTTTLNRSYRHESLADVALDIANMTGTEISVNFNQKTILFSNFITMTFEFPLLPSDDDLDLEANKAKNDKDSPSSATTSSKYKSSVFKSIVEEIEKFLVEGALTFNEYEASVTVTAPRAEMTSILARVDAIKERLEKQIVVEYTIAEIYWNSEDAKELYMEAVFDKVLDGISIKSGSINPTINADGTLTMNKPYRFDSHNTVSGVLNLAKTYGKTNRIVRSTLTLQNGYPASINVGTRANYLSGATINVDEGVTTITYENDEYSEGMTLHMIAKVVGDNSILISLNPSLTSKVAENDLLIASGTATGEVRGNFPVLQDRTSLHRFMVPNNSVMMLGGMQDAFSSDANKDFAVVPTGRTDIQRRRDVIMLMSTRIANINGEYIENFE